MNRLELDFVARPQAGAARRWAIMVCGVVLLVGQLGYWLLQLQPRQLALSETLLKQVKTLRQPEPVNRLKADEFAKLLGQAHEVDQQLKLPWNALFTFMDKASGTDLALVALEPDSNKGQLVIIAEARNYAAMLDFYAAMQGSALFSDVTLQSHVINKNVPEQPIRFRLRARWMIRS